MKGFVLGLLVAALGFGGYFYWRTAHEPRSAEAPAVRADAGAVTKKKRRRRGATRLAHARAGGDPAALARNADPTPDPEPEPDPDPPIKLSAADKRIVSQGDDLGRPDIVHLDMSDGKDLPELSQDEIDARFRPREEAILDCISRARPDPELYVPGTVTIKFRIQRAGTVRGVRVEGPAVLQKGGLYPCVKGIVQGLRFPEGGSSQIVSYPFRLS